MEELIRTVIIFLGAVLALIGLAYMVARVASIAHFRTKLEYFKQLMREGVKHGKE